MRRRAAPEFRRPARTRLSKWIWWLLGLFMSGGLLLFVLHHYHHDRSGPLFKEKGPRPNETAHWSFNLTEELLSSTSFARQLADQMTLSKAYVVISKEHGNLQLAWELSSQIRNCQRLLSQTAVQGKILSAKEAQPMIARLAQLIYRAQDLHYDVSTTIVTLKKHAQAMEERARAATAQSAQFGRMAAESLPKSLHCLNVMLLQEWSANPGLRKLAETHTKSPALADTNLYHFCVFSDNVLATSVVVNSTVSNADHPRLLVFHIVTDGVNYKAMTSWFLSSSKDYYRGSSFEVRSLEEFDWLNASCSGESAINHLRFYIPEIYPSLERIVFLDDDVVVQKDLTQLFSLDLHGNVNGAVETCLESHHRFYKFLNFSDPWISSSGIDPQACGWAFGVNVFDLIAWKKAGVTARYRIWQERNAGKTLWKAGALPVGLLAFYGLIEPLDRRWHVSGLGYDLHIDDRLIQSAAVLHFSGTLKPWLSLSPPRYMDLWTHYLHSQSPLFRSCVSKFEIN